MSIQWFRDIGYEAWVASTNISEIIETLGDTSTATIYNDIHIKQCAIKKHRITNERW